MPQTNGPLPYNALISACEKSKQVKKALWIFAQMEAQEVEPSAITYNALISIITLLINGFVRSFIRSFIRSFVRSFIRSFVRSAPA